MHVNWSFARQILTLEDSCFICFFQISILALFCFLETNGLILLLSFKFLFLCFLFLKMLLLPGPWIFRQFMLFPSTLMLLLPGSWFFRPRWCFYCPVHVSSVEVALMLLLSGSCFFHPKSDAFVVRLGWCFCCEVWFCCVHDFSVQAFVAMFIFFPSTLSWWFGCEVHAFCVHADAFSVHVRLMLLLQGSCFFRCFCFFILFKLMLFPKGNLKCTVGFQFIFLFLFIFFVTHIILWICSL